MADPLTEVRKASERLTARQRATDEAREALHQAIWAAYRAGESMSAIARAAGMSRQWIARVLGG